MDCFQSKRTFYLVICFRALASNVWGQAQEKDLQYETILVKEEEKLAVGSRAGYEKGTLNLGKWRQKLGKLAEAKDATSAVCNRNAKKG